MAWEESERSTVRVLRIPHRHTSSSLKWKGVCVTDPENFAWGGMPPSRSRQVAVGRTSAISLDPSTDFSQEQGETQWACNDSLVSIGEYIMFRHGCFTWKKQCLSGGPIAVRAVLMPPTYGLKLLVHQSSTLLLVCLNPLATRSID